MAKPGYSEKWAMWICDILSFKTCLQCRGRFQKIIAVEDRSDHPPIHENCRCYLEPLKAVQAGTATKKGEDGADWHLLHYGQLPEYYVSTQKAKDLGWEKRKCNLSVVAPGKMIGGGVFNNFNNKLPDTSERIWYEADINYEQGCRNASRLVYSNDGLIFVTYDHYQTFQEIVD